MRKGGGSEMPAKPGLKKNRTGKRPRGGGRYAFERALSERRNLREGQDAISYLKRIPGRGGTRPSPSWERTLSKNRNQQNRSGGVRSGVCDGDKRTELSNRLSQRRKQKANFVTDKHNHIHGKRGAPGGELTGAPRIIDRNDS